MPIFEVQGRDGAIYEVDAPDEGAAVAGFQKFQAGENAAPKSTFDAAVEGMSPPIPQVSPELAAMSYGDIAKAADNAVRVGANAMTFGLADRFAGTMDAATGRAPSVSAGIDAQHAATEAVRKEAPRLALGAEIAGGLTGGLGLMKNGVTLAGRFGPSLMGRVFGYGLEGAGYGAAHGAGNTYTGNPMDYVENAKKGATAGFAIGAGLPVAGSVASNAYRAGSAFLGPQIQGAGRGASAMMRAAALADEAGLRALPSKGPDAMLVDAGPSMLGLGQGAATGTGEGRSLLVHALTNRDRATGSRIADTLESNIGPSPRPSQVEAHLSGDRAYAGLGYEPLMAEADAVMPRALADQLDVLATVERGPAQRAAEQVRAMLDGPPRLNAPIGARPPLDDNPATLLNTRQAIDGMLGTEKDTNAIRVLTQARNAVDDELRAAVPGIKNVDAEIAELSRQSEGLQRGSQVFDTGKTAIRPADLQDELTRSAQPQGAMVGPSAAPFRVRQGARAEIDRLVGTNVNDLNALERKLGTPQDWNAQKMAVVFGDVPTQRIAEALMNNRQFRDVYQKIVQNSQTAQRTSASKAMEGSEGGNVPVGATMTGLGLKALNAIAKAVAGASSASTKDQIGRVLATNGPEAMRIAQALLQSAQQSGQNAQSIARVLSSPNWIGASTPAAGRR